MIEQLYGYELDTARDAAAPDYDSRARAQLDVLVAKVNELVEVVNDLVVAYKEITAKEQL